MTGIELPCRAVVPAFLAARTDQPARPVLFGRINPGLLSIYVYQGGGGFVLGAEDVLYAWNDYGGFRTVIRSGKRYPVARNTRRVIESTRLIRSFRCKHTEALFRGEKPKRFSAFARVAQRKLRQLAAAHELSDLSIFPGNHLEALKGNREGQYSIRVNDRFRICFVWREGDAYDVEIVDYH